MPRVVPSDVLNVIWQIYPWANPTSSEFYAQPSSLTGDHVGPHSTILALAEAIPPELQPRSPGDAVQFVAAIGALRGAITVWGADLRWPMPPRPEFGDRRVGPRHAVFALAEVLARCPDVAPAVTTAELPFIDDVARRETIRQDMSSAEHALGVGEYKAAAVLAGSALEALLLWAVEREDSPAVATAGATWKAEPNPAAGSGIPQYDKRVETKAPAEWQLAPLTEMAFHVGVIDRSCRDAARLARDARNLVHPGKTQREGARVSKAIALQAIAAMERVAEQLAARYASAPVASTDSPAPSDATEAHED